MQGNAAGDFEDRRSLQFRDLCKLKISRELIKSKLASVGVPGRPFCDSERKVRICFVHFLSFHRMS